ncbi:MAG: PAC2 family protein, partial [Dehalococcoidales bacterium]
MAVILYQEPLLKNPDLIASWSGIGNIGLVTVDTLQGQVGAEELGMIEPWEFHYPSKVTIRDGVIADLTFPANKFSYKRLANRDLLFFTGEEQPADGNRIYAEGMKAYQMANMVLDTAEKFGCRRIYTSGAAVALTHHTLKPRVWAVGSQEALLIEIKKHENTILMGDALGRGEHGTITGLNGLMLGLARKRGLEAICLMGEIPDYLSG